MEKIDEILVLKKYKRKLLIQKLIFWVPNLLVLIMIIVFEWFVPSLARDTIHWIQGGLGISMVLYFFANIFLFRAYYFESLYKGKFGIQLSSVLKKYISQDFFNLRLKVYYKNFENVSCHPVIITPFSGFAIKKVITMVKNNADLPEDEQEEIKF